MKKKPEMAYMLTEKGRRVVDRTIRRSKRNRNSIIALLICGAVAQLRMDILENDFRHHIDEYHKGIPTEGK
jgi:hypothetical protein